MKSFLFKIALIATLALALVYVSHALYLEREAWRFKALAYHDFIPDAERLRAEGRLSEARAVLDFVLSNPELPRQAEAKKLRDDIQGEMSSWLSKAKRLGLGALTGRGSNTEGVIGAITADMFVVGDVRDLVIQGWRYATGNDADPVVAALSLIGIATTLAPEIDWAPSFLKIARRTGMMTKRFAEFLVELARETKRTKSSLKAMECLKDTGALVKRVGPSQALGLMRCVETERDIKIAAQFAEHAPGAAYTALNTGGREALRLLEKQGPREGADIVVEAAKRGPEGIAAASRMSPALFRAHFGVGAAKSVWKGNLREAAMLALSRLSRGKLLGLWCVLALALSGVLTWTVAPVVRWCFKDKSRTD